MLYRPLLVTQVSVSPGAISPSHPIPFAMRAKPMSFSKFIAIALVCYLGYILFRAHGKLRERKIGTVFQMMGEKTVKEISNLHYLFLCHLTNLVIHQKNKQISCN